MRTGTVLDEVGVLGMDHPAWPHAQKAHWAGDGVYAVVLDLLDPYGVSVREDGLAVVEVIEKVELAGLVVGERRYQAASPLGLHPLSPYAGTNLRAGNEIGWVRLDVVPKGPTASMLARGATVLALSKLARLGALEHPKEVLAEHSSGS
jgi:hypothetical protein